MNVNPELLNDLKEIGPFNADACFNCGTCTGLCPIGLDILPRSLFRYAILGVEAKILENVETIYTCLLCKMCEKNCPQEVNITENVLTLRNYVSTKIFNLK